MREIKFRYFNKVNNLMVNNPEMPFKKGWTIEQLFSDRGWVWMQFTGLKDKNGKEIYEGDIVRILYTDWGSKDDSDPRTLEQYLIDIASIGSIVYSPPTFEIAFPCNKHGYVDFGRIKPGDHGYIEVIGNIYENPELLEKI